MNMTDVFLARHGRPVPDQMLEGRTISNQAFIVALAEAVQERPDYAYQPIPEVDEEGNPIISEVTGEPYTKCRYLENDGVTGSCGVGVALVACGVNPEWIKVREGGAACNLLMDLGLSPEVGYLASNFQADQDGGVPWREALQRAALKSSLTLSI